MNENLQQKMQTYDTWLREATSRLKQSDIPSAQLDAELILSHTIRKPRTYLHAHGDEQLDKRREDIANARIELRLENTPVAYIIGHKDFYGRSFITTPAALVPRPESESFMTLLKEIIPTNTSLLDDKLNLIDVGTGTGCLGITAKLEWPELDVTLIDIDNHALNLAKENADKLGADVHFIKANLLHGVVLPVDIIIANLPYVDRSWDVSPDTTTEPDLALYADNNGLALINKLIVQSTTLLNTGGHLLLESDIRQHDAIIQFAKSNGFRHVQTEGLITRFTKI